MKSSGLMEAIVELSHERGLDQDSIIEAIEDAIVGAAYRKYKNYKNIEAQLNRQSGEIELMHYKTVVQAVTDPDNEIALEEVLKLDPEAEEGDEVEYEIDPTEFTSVIAQTARQLIFQKINEAEREAVLDKFQDKKGEIVHGTVARIERSRVVVMVGGNVEAALERREQIPFEKLQPGEHVRALLLDVKTDGRGPQLLLSRTHPAFLMKLVEMEVPEVFDGVIDVMAAAREPGKRAKLAVRSNDSEVDPVGSCVGVKGSRIQAVVSELCGERIDVVEYSPHLDQFIENALAPAEIMEMELDEEEKTANIKVAVDQLSLAIGKQGQNVRLASRLTEVSLNISPWEPTEDEDPIESLARAREERERQEAQDAKAAFEAAEAAMDESRAQEAKAAQEAMDAQAAQEAESGAAEPQAQPETNSEEEAQEAKEEPSQE